jgi:hypothetical protein
MELRTMLGLADDTHKTEWNQIRVCSHPFFDLDSLLTTLDHREGFDAYRSVRLGIRLEVATATKAQPIV